MANNSHYISETLGYSFSSNLKNSEVGKWGKYIPIPGGSGRSLVERLSD